MLGPQFYILVRQRYFPLAPDFRYTKIFTSSTFCWYVKRCSFSVFCAVFESEHVWTLSSHLNSVGCGAFYCVSGVRFFCQSFFSCSAVNLASCLLAVKWLAACWMLRPASGRNCCCQVTMSVFVLCFVCSAVRLRIPLCSFLGTHSKNMCSCSDPCST